MQVTFDRVDMEACRRAGNKKPSQVIRREQLETWLVPTEPITMDRPPTFALFRQGDFLSIPLIPYLLNKEPDLAIAHMYALALNCAFTLNNPVSRLHIVTGVPLEALPEDPNSEYGFRYWVGFGALLSK